MAGAAAKKAHKKSVTIVMDVNDDNQIPFDPHPQDVVSTKNRTWNLNHPGNLRCQEYLLNYANELPHSGNFPPNLIAEFADEIVHKILKEEYGQFLKPIVEPGGNTFRPEYCIVMDKKAAKEKVKIGLNNKFDALKRRNLLGLKHNRTLWREPEGEREAPLPPPQHTELVSPELVTPPVKRGPGRPKGSGPKQKLMAALELERQQRQQEEQQYAEESSLEVSEPPEAPTVRYKAKQKRGGPKIHPYALALVTRVCNHPSGRLVLDSPGPSVVGTESEHERLMRLQLRHRFIAAAADNMSLVDFADRIVKIWGGILDVTTPNDKNSPRKRTRRARQEEQQQQKKAKIAKKQETDWVNQNVFAANASAETDDDSSLEELAGGKFPLGRPTRPLRSSSPMVVKVKPADKPAVEALVAEAADDSETESESSNN